ncbi:PCMD domain-containing protein [Parabacteroides pacaensis]|uniref:PCMD domain-containing protein n=1 Tax=Parabacteroides pacaensis TaxID=2086575 RepID=UPI000D0E66B0|nr:PCMD domain-containing protein [Parabacteroides pacaensis]
MKLTSLIFCLFLTLSLTSCIQDEALNAEADIVTCTVPGDVLNRDPIIENDKITLIVKGGTDISVLAPSFTLTPGATIIPANGSVLDFTTPQYYEVTSQDRQWTKKYEVGVTFSGVSNTKYHFENVKFNKSGKYHVFYETDVQGKENMTWASGNEGFSLTGLTDENGESIKANAYPTSQTDNGVVGKCLKLQTLETGALGALMGMKIAAGNLFLGSFTVNISDILKSTKFGMQFSYVPTYLKGYYKYKRGKVFQDNGTVIPDKKDICDIYAVFYETDEKMQILDGTNVLAEDNKYIVSIARINDARETEEWIEFNLPFVYREGKTIDPEKLRAGKYNLAIVFSSSIRGDHFEGAPGSTLYIDEVELGYEE